MSSICRHSVNVCWWTDWITKNELSPKTNCNHLPITVYSNCIHKVLEKTFTELNWSTCSLIKSCYFWFNKISDNGDNDDTKQLYNIHCSEGYAWHCIKCFMCTYLILISTLCGGLPWWLRGKESTHNAGDTKDSGLIPGSWRFPGGGHGNPLQYSCLESPMDRGARWATVHGIEKIIRHNWNDLWMWFWLVDVVLTCGWEPGDLSRFSGTSSMPWPHFYPRQSDSQSSALLLWIHFWGKHILV